ncbi:hypothetical protein [Mycolicibacterium psychrotolerans]|nr:hypothetical protein [Mycolicibacterium psychrotolerans]
MTTINPKTNPPVPDGAEADVWTDHNTRDVYIKVGCVSVATLLQCPTVTVLAEQRRDGSLGCIDVLLDVAMGRSDAGLSSGQARELAGLLIAGADRADRLAGQ